MKAKKKAWIVIIVLAVIGFCVGFYFGYNGEKDKQEQTNTQTRTQEKEIRAQGERLPLRRPRRKFIRQFYWRQRTGRKRWPMESG